MSSIPDPKTWATGGDPATDKQKNFLATLANDKGVDINVDEVDKSTACAKIDELKNSTTTSTGLDPAAAPTAPDEISQKENENAPITNSDDPATEKQKRYLAVLEQGEDHEGLSKEEASRRISELK